MLLCESEKHQHFETTLGSVFLPFSGLFNFVPVFILLLFSQSFSAKQSVHFRFRTILLSVDDVKIKSKCSRFFLFAQYNSNCFSRVHSTILWRQRCAKPSDGLLMTDLSYIFLPCLTTSNRPYKGTGSNDITLSGDQVCEISLKWLLRKIIIASIDFYANTINYKYSIVPPKM